MDSSISPLELLDAQVHVGLRQLVLPVSIRLQGSMFNGRLIQIYLLLQFSQLFLLREETHGFCFMDSFNVNPLLEMLSDISGQTDLQGFADVFADSAGRLGLLELQL